MRASAVSLDEIRLAIAPELKKGGAVLAILFGSYGRGEADEPSDYVLESLNRATRERLEMAADAASEALIPWLEEGIECSMNCFNAVAAPEPEQDEPTNES